jgi:hypothetical protein
MLRRPEPIHYYQEFCLYEDELADHGCSHLSVRMVSPSLLNRPRGPCPAVS